MGNCDWTTLYSLSLCSNRSHVFSDTAKPRIEVPGFHRYKLFLPLTYMGNPMKYDIEPLCHISLGEPGICTRPGFYTRYYGIL